jgi:hypothetical protein
MREASEGALRRIWGKRLLPLPDERTISQEESRGRRLRLVLANVLSCPGGTTSRQSWHFMAAIVPAK